MEPQSVHSLQADIFGLQCGCADCSLRDICFPAGASDADRCRIKSSVTPAGPYRRGQYVFRRGDQFAAIYAVREGSLKSVVTDPIGRERVVGFHFPGDAFGFEAISIGRHQSDCIALELTSLCALSYGAMQEFALRYPSLYAELIDLMSREMSRQRAVGAAVSAKERLAAFLLSLTERLAKVDAYIDEVELRMTRQDIAFYLGMAPETLSRLFAELESRQIITVRGKKICFLDRARLESIAVWR